MNNSPYSDFTEYPKSIINKKGGVILPPKVYILKISSNVFDTDRNGMKNNRRRGLITPPSVSHDVRERALNVRGTLV